MPNFRPYFRAASETSRRDIAISVSPRAALHAVLSLLCWPQTETVVVFSDEDHVFRASSFNCAHPLLRIKIGRIEYPRIGSAVPHSRSRNVFVPKWMMTPNSRSCQATCLRRRLDVNEVLRLRYGSPNVGSK